jgi:hypothetical protein
MKYRRLGMLTIFLSYIFMAFSPAEADFSRSEKQAMLEYARACLISRVTDTAPPLAPEWATRQQRACFVTFFSGRRVFACFGSFVPRKSSLADEISENIRLALKNDARSRTINRETVARAGVQITFPVGQPVFVASYRDIDPASEGMFVEGSGGGVAFVPGEARTARWAFSEALRRLGVRDAASVAVYRFKAEAVSTL